VHTFLYRSTDVSFSFILITSFFHVSEYVLSLATFWVKFRVSSYVKAGDA
jgi:hypothetical protein